MPSNEECRVSVSQVPVSDPSLLDRAVKRGFDLLVGTAALLVSGPLMGGIAIAVRATTPGPALFRQERIGLNGRSFRMLKFRTMVVGAESIGDGLFTYEGDPRVTPLGWHLRSMSLDELPQLLNVLAGSMSMVGPRPAVTYELGPISELPPEYLARFQTKPGITGLAQVSGRNNLTWDQKVALDNEYLARYRRLGILEDIRILAKTLLAVIKRSDTLEKRGEDCDT
jgi:lipopolysaccharide/colanic/teichoic acid biosynthesis glycosyltransferase